MKNKRYFNIRLSVETDGNTTMTEFTDKVMELVESNNWTVGGGFVETDEEGNEIKSND